MNINITSRVGQTMETYRPTAKRTAEQRKNVSVRDEISISPEARLFEFSKKAASNIPDIREDKVAAIMKRLENGTYNVPVSALVDKMI